MHHLSGRRVGKLKRLFVFAGGSIRYALQLNGLEPTQYWMDHGELHPVKGQNHLSHWTKYLADQKANARPMVFVLGAGFSSESRPPDLQRRAPLLTSTYPPLPVLGVR